VTLFSADIMDFVLAPTGEWWSSAHGDGNIRRRARVKRYVTERRHKAVSIWPGDPSHADPASNPKAVFTGCLPTACDYQRATDNTMDITHAEYLHVGALDTQGALGKKLWMLPRYIS
jgi:phenylpropionate dioxygenase-like ring-hydroxylating dioxygenase large terminal subunit